MNTTQKNNVLHTLAELLEQGRRSILDANGQDISLCSEADASLIERLKVNDDKISGMIRSVLEVANMDDPEGKVLYSTTREDGLKVENRTVPFGKILIIYESRPDVTIEAAATAFKAGNSILLKGGKESRNTNLALVTLWQEALEKNGVNKECVTYLDLSREEIQTFISDGENKLDLIIPRGGDTLINFVKNNAAAPVMISGRGNNFMYIDSESDFGMAINIALNGKQRLSVCNALDKILINKNVPDLKTNVELLVTSLCEHDIEVYGSTGICALNARIEEVQGDAMFKEEFLSAKMLLSIVDNLDLAIDIINKYSGGHSAVIVTANATTAEKFQNEVDCGAVYHNASTRFTDGGQFGLGAEIAISTQKLHFRGPIGAGQLVTNKWFVKGDGHIRT